MLAISPDDILLHQIAVPDMPDVPKEHGGAVRIGNGNVIERLYRGRHRVCAHRVLGLADLRGAARQGQVLGIDGVDDLQRCQPFRQQLCLVDIDHDLPVFSAGRCRQGDAVHWRDHLAQPVDPVIIELRFAQPVRAEADLHDRNGRRAVLYNHRRLNAGRHQRADRIGGRDNLRDREVEIDVRLEIDLLHRDAVDGFGLDVPDAVDVGADRVLAVGSDALLHLGRVETGVLPDHRHHRNVDLGKDVRRHFDRSSDAEEQD